MYFFRKVVLICKLLGLKDHFKGPKSIKEKMVFEPELQGQAGVPWCRWVKAFPMGDDLYRLRVESTR